MSAENRKLMVSVTKTDAQGKAIQKTTPNMMSFSSNMNSIHFNGQRYGVRFLGTTDVDTLTSETSLTYIENAFGTLDAKTLHDTIMSELSRGIIYIAYYKGFYTLCDAANMSVGNNIVYLFVKPTSNHLSSRSIVFDGPTGSNIQGVTVSTFNFIENSVTSTLTTKALSANQGKLLNDAINACVKKSSIVNNLTSTSTTNPLSAAQGKTLNDKITTINTNINNINGGISDINGNISNINQRLTNVANSVAKAYTPKGSVNDYNALRLITSAKVGDVYNVLTEFVINNKTYAAGTNVVCITAFTTVAGNTDLVWDPLGGIMGKAVAPIINIYEYITNSITITQQTSTTPGGRLVYSSGSKKIAYKLNNIYYNNWQIDDIDPALRDRSIVVNTNNEPIEYNNYLINNKLHVYKNNTMYAINCDWNHTIINIPLSSPTNSNNLNINTFKTIFTPTINKNIYTFLNNINSINRNIFIDRYAISGTVTGLGPYTYDITLMRPIGECGIEYTHINFKTDKSFNATELVTYNSTINISDYNIEQTPTRDIINTTGNGGDGDIVKLLGDCKTFYNAVKNGRRIVESVSESNNYLYTTKGNSNSEIIAELRDEDSGFKSIILYKKYGNNLSYRLTVYAVNIVMNSSYTAYDYYKILYDVELANENGNGILIQ